MHSVNFILALACGTFAMASTVDNGATHTGTMSALVTSNPDVAVDIYGPPCCFAKNCKAYDFETQNHTLTGTCWNKITQRDWEEVNSEIDLNLCVGNQNGTLISQSLGNYASTCSNCSMNLTVLVCDCETMVGTSINSQLNLNTFVSDDFPTGVLHCFDNSGKKTA